MKEDVARGDGKCAFAVPGSECCSKSQRVEMTAVVRCEDKGAVRRQVFAANNCETMRDREITSDQRKTSVVREALEKSAFAAHAAKPLAWTQAGVAGWLKIPGFH